MNGLKAQLQALREEVIERAEAIDAEIDRQQENHDAFVAAVTDAWAELSESFDPMNDNKPQDVVDMCVEMLDKALKRDDPRW